MTKTFAAFFAFFLALASASEALAARTLAGNLSADTAWSGEVVLAQSVAVPPGVTLTVEPGARILAASGAALAVQGRLVVRGTAEKPVEFLPQDGAAWGGITLSNAVAPAEIRFARFVGGRIEVVESALILSDTTFENAAVGVALLNGGRSRLERCRFVKFTEAGVVVSRGVQAEIVACRFEECSATAVEVNQQGVAKIVDSRFGAGSTGVAVVNAKAEVLRNEFQGLGVAVVAFQSGHGMRVEGNRISGGGQGVLCKQYASPLVAANRFKGLKEGVVCVLGSNPEIVRNLFEENERALSCVQLSAPKVEKNVFTGNKTAIYLHLSSYPEIRRNNFSKNALHVELDNMSADWEHRVLKKGARGQAARSQTLAERGKLPPPKTPEFKPPKDYVDAEDNWWGADTTQEMIAKGADADIAAFKDYYDIPTRAYEGFPGEYAQDRVRYANWRAEPVPDAGPPEGGKGGPDAAR